jgi:hypothetical protein
MQASEAVRRLLGCGGIVPGGGEGDVAVTSTRTSNPDAERVDEVTPEKRLKSLSAETIRNQPSQGGDVCIRWRLPAVPLA